MKGMTFSIRSMEVCDIDAVLSLERKIPEAPHWNRADYECRTGFIAASEGRLLGFSVAKLVVDICELESIAVAEEARGQGIGKALFQAVVEWARSRNALRVELEVRASNIRAIMFYERFGLCTEAVRRRYYQSPEEDAILMGLFLDPGGKPA
jgi:ribosomal-protein-alanine N-acetyltransferase